MSNFKKKLQKVASDDVNKVIANGQKLSEKLEDILTQIYEGIDYKTQEEFAQYLNEHGYDGDNFLSTMVTLDENIDEIRKIIDTELIKRNN